MDGEEPRRPVIRTPDGGAIVVVGDTYADIARLARKIAFRTRGRIDWGDCPPTAGIGMPGSAYHEERLNSQVAKGGDPYLRGWM